MDHADAYAIERAEKLDIPVHVTLPKTLILKEYEQQLLQYLKRKK